jgi:hypothetical protein
LSSAPTDLSGANAGDAPVRRWLGGAWRATWLLPVVVFLASLGAALREGLAGAEGHLVYAVDDAYIHMAVAKNFARAGLWGCTPFHFSSSSSSLLWTFALGVAYRLFGVRDLMPLVLNVACAVAALLLADRCLARLGVAPLLRVVTLLALLIACPMAGMTLLGMEHLLHLALTIAFASAAVEALTAAADGEGGRARTIRLCILAALLATSRWEGLFLIACACLAFLLRRQPGRAVAIVLASALPLAAFGAISVANGGFFLPNSLVLKAAGDSGGGLAAIFKPIGADDLEFFRSDPALLVLLASALVGALAQWRLRGGPWRAPVLFPLFLAAMIVLHAHYVFSPAFWVYRYDAYLAGFGVLVAAVVLADVRAPAALPAGATAALLVAGLTAIVADVREGLVPQSEIEGMRNTYLEHYQAAQFVARYYPDRVVAVNDLGAVSYATDARILDLVGLGDVEPLRIMRSSGGYTSRDVLEWTAPYQPRVAIVQLGWGWIVPRIPDQWIKVAEVEVPTHHQRIGFFAVDPGEAWVLRESVEQHYATVGRGLGYRVKLRSPERMNQLAALAPPPGTVR